MTENKDPVLAATRWRTNAELIADCARLGYIKKTDKVLDPTLGRGTWWNAWKPDQLVARSRAEEPGWDFRKTDYLDGEFDAVAYDPPYVSKGGRATSGMKEMDARYGQDKAAKSPALLQDVINEGLTEMRRVVRSGGIVLCKCQDYVSSGKLWPGTFFTQQYAFKLGMETIDRLEHVGSVRAQPPDRRQVHARRNLSTLFIFRK